MYQNVLIAFEHLPGAATALARGIALAAVPDARVRALWVEEPPADGMLMADASAAVSAAVLADRDEFTRLAAGKLRAHLRALEEAHAMTIPLEQRAGGTVAQEVLSAARGHPCDLLVLGNLGPWTWHRRLLGHPVGQVAKSSVCDVLIARTTDQNAPRHGYRRILAADDHLPGVSSVFQKSIALARATAARLATVPMYQRGPGGELPEVDYLCEARWDEWAADPGPDEPELPEALPGWSGERCRAAQAADALIGAAQRGGFDLIVLGTRDRGPGWREPLAGRLLARVGRLTPCDVLLTRESAVAVHTATR